MVNHSLHYNHCCPIHGCKWSERDCPIVSGTEKSGPCRICLNADYPTEDAYLAACRALWKHREAEEKLEAANRTLSEKNKALRNEVRILKKRMATLRRKTI